MPTYVGFSTACSSYAKMSIIALDLVLSCKDNDATILASRSIRDI